MNNLIMRRMAVSEEYQPLVAESLVGSVTISTPPGNQATVHFKGDDGSDVPWVPGEWHTFRSVDLSTFQVKGTTGDIVTVVGGTW
ncbi:MAG: hypothetical protein GXY74_13435 [Phycisphaerae bacterium]|mgnify:CR=1 FL=1|nr:hypothetical protein [Phycisphaerae bacterium]